MEDLWAFNSEELAYAIYNCRIPVISAVGHETDFTICDFVSDMRAPTPSAGAELAVPDREELMSYYNSQLQYVTSVKDLKIRQCSNSVTDFRRRLSLVSPQSKINEYEKSLTNKSNIFRKIISEIYNEKSNSILKLSSKLEGLNPISVLARGYSIAEKDGQVISSKAQLKIDDEFTLEFSDGKIRATVTGD